MELTVGLCSVRDSSNLFHVENPGLELGEEINLCESDDHIIDLSNLIVDNLVWQDGSNSDVYTINEEGIYWVEASIQNCSFTDSLFVTTWNSPEISLPEDTSLCSGTVLELVIPSGNYDLEWQDGSSSNSFSISEEGIYTVNATNKCGSDFADINVQYELCECMVVIPDAFSPNADKLNDVFIPKTDCKFDDFVFKVFYRSGREIFHSTTPLNPWTGMEKGKPLPEGFYVYTFEYNTSNNEEKVMQYGIVSLIR